VGHEGALALDLLVKGGQSIAVGLGREAGDGPKDLAEEVHDSANVVEHGPQCLLAEIDHEQPSGLAAATACPGLRRGLTG